MKTKRLIGKDKYFNFVIIYYVNIGLYRVFLKLHNPRWKYFNILFSCYLLIYILQNTLI